MEDLAIRMIKAKGAIEFCKANDLTPRKDHPLATESQILNHFDIPQAAGEALLEEIARDRAKAHQKATNDAATIHMGRASQQPQAGKDGQPAANALPLRPKDAKQQAEPGPRRRKLDGYWYQGRWQTMKELDEEFE